MMVKNNTQLIIVQGKPSHLDDLRREAINPGAETDVCWTCPGQVKTGDLMLIYLMSPVSAIVGIALFDSEPFINDDDESDWFGKKMAAYKNLKILKPENYITIKEMRELFPDWFWVFRPQGSVVIPDKPGRRIKQPFLALLAERVNG